MNAQKKRLDWLDILRAISMYLVVIGHATGNNETGSYRFFIYSFHMPLFFMISGASYYLQTRSREYRFGEMMRNKARTLLLPYFTLNLISLFIWIFNFKVLSDSETTVWEKIYAIFISNEGLMSSPTNATWFLTALFLTTLVFFLLQAWSKGDEKVLILSSAVLGLSGYANSVGEGKFDDLPWHLNVVPTAVLFFLIGYLFLKYLGKFDEAIGGYTRQVLIFSVCLVCGFLCAASNRKISMAYNAYGSLVLFLGSSLSFSICMVLISMWIRRSRTLQFIGKNTIVCLAFHSPIFRFLENVSGTTRGMLERHPIIMGTAVFIILIPVEYLFDKYFWSLLGRKPKTEKERNTMAFWDNISKKATEATSKTVQKTKDLSEINRLNGLISEEETKMDSIYREIGMLYCSLHGDDKEREFLDMVSSVKESNDRIEGYRKQIRDIKGITCCPECGEEMSKDARFCSSCGTKLTTQDTKSEKTISAEHTCPGCGSPLPESAKFCSVCGAEIPDLSEASEAQQTPEE